MRPASSAAHFQVATTDSLDSAKFSWNIDCSDQTISVELPLGRVSSRGVRGYNGHSCSCNIPNICRHRITALVSVV